MEASTDQSDAFLRHRGRFEVAAVLLATMLLIAVGVMVFVDRAENAGLSDKQLRQIEARCHEKASDATAVRGVDFDEAFERCQQAEKTYRGGGDPFPPN